MKLKRALSILLALVFVLTLLPAVSAPALAATLISSVSITLDAPAKGARPDYTAVFPSGAHYYSDAYNERDFRNDILWEDVTNGTEDVDPDSGVFLAGHVYKVWIYLTAEDGYEFSSSATATVNGQTVQARMSGSQLMVEYTFPPLPEAVIVYSGSCGPSLTWTLSDDGVLTIYGSGPMTDFESWTDVPWYRHSSSVSSVVIESGVTTIGDTAFTDMLDITSITIPEGVTRIGSVALACCYGLTSVTLPDSITTIEEDAFHCVKNMTSIKLPANLTTIGNLAFSDCHSLKNVTIPYGTREIGDSAFLQCYNLESVTIPGTVTRIGELAFADCKKLTNVTIDPAVFNIHGSAFIGTPFGSTLWSHGNYAMLNNIYFAFVTPDSVPDGELLDVVIPGEATAIAPIAFESCRKVGSITVPAEVNFIGDYAFSNCKDLNTIIFQGHAPTFGGSNVFGFVYEDLDCRVTATAYYPVGDPTWTADVMQNYGGMITWVPMTAPAITTHPSNRAVAVGAKAIFKVVASGDDLTYQWQYSRNGTTWTDKAGATSASYTVTAKASYNGLYYRCKVSNAGGEVFSNKARLTVTSTAKPVITTQPANKTVAAGASATFTVAASGTGLTYQWQYSKNNGSSWTNKSGATSASYTVTAKESYNGMLYRCIVTNAGGSVTSGTAKLTVTVAKPVITTQPKAATAAVGATATYKVVASGTGLTYQWQYSSDYGATWHNKSGATSASYTVTAKATYNGMLYRCRVKNSAGTVYSSKVRLTVSGVKPKVLSQPKAATAAAGGSVTFKVIAAGTGISYQWQYSTNGGTTWEDRTGATSATYTVTAKASYNGIQYRCRVKNSYGTVYSESAKLTVS